MREIFNFTGKLIVDHRQQVQTLHYAKCLIRIRDGSGVESNQFEKSRQLAQVGFLKTGLRTLLITLLKPTAQKNGVLQFLCFVDALSINGWQIGGQLLWANLQCFVRMLKFKVDLTMDKFQFYSRKYVEPACSQWVARNIKISCHSRNNSVDVDFGCKLVNKSVDPITSLWHTAQNCVHFITNETKPADTCFKNVAT